MVYDKYIESSPSDSNYHSSYYLQCKVNGIVSCDINDYDSINEGDIIYIVKILPKHNIIKFYQKNAVLFDQDLNKYIKENNYTYLKEIKPNDKYQYSYSDGFIINKNTNSRKKNVNNNIKTAICIVIAFLLFMISIIGFLKHKNTEIVKIPYLFYYYLIISIQLIIASIIICKKKKNIIIILNWLPAHIESLILSTISYFCLFIEDVKPLIFLYILMFSCMIIHILIMYGIIQEAKWEENNKF